MPNRLLLQISILAISAGLVGCAEIQVIGGEKTTTFYELGVLRIIPDASDQILFTKTSGFGLVPLANGAAVGWASQELIAVTDPKQCHLIVMVADRIEFQKIADQLRASDISIEHICEIRR